MTPWCAIVKRMRELGVLVNAIGTAFELAPPLIAPRSALDRTVRVAAQAIDEVARARNLVWPAWLRGNGRRSAA